MNRNQAHIIAPTGANVGYEAGRPLEAARQGYQNAMDANAAFGRTAGSMGSGFFAYNPTKWSNRKAAILGQVSRGNLHTPLKAGGGWSDAGKNWAAPSTGPFQQYMYRNKNAKNPFLSTTYWNASDYRQASTVAPRIQNAGGVLNVAQPQQAEQDQVKYDLNVDSSYGDSMRINPNSQPTITAPNAVQTPQQLVELANRYQSSIAPQTSPAQVDASVPAQYVTEQPAAQSNTPAIAPQLGVATSQPPVSTLQTQQELPQPTAPAPTQQAPVTRGPLAISTPVGVGPVATKPVVPTVGKPILPGNNAHGPMQPGQPIKRPVLPVKPVPKPIKPLPKPAAAKPATPVKKVAR